MELEQIEEEVKKIEMESKRNSEEIVIDEEEDVFDGEYEEIIEKEYYADPKALAEMQVNYTNLNTNRRPKRNFLFKLVISQPKRYFEGHTAFTDKEPGTEGTNLDIKPAKANEYLMGEKAYLDIGLQTPNDAVEKSFQVMKKPQSNKLTQVETDNADIKPYYAEKQNFYITNNQKIIDIENFLKRIRPRMEEALQSNETIDIFQNDFELDKNQIVSSDNVDKKGEKNPEIRTFRDNSIAGQKSKKEKSVNCIKFINSEEVYLAHSLIRNLNFEDRMKSIGIPHQTQILFWNFKDHEINSPIFHIDIPMEVTYFDFCPTNANILICGLLSGQLIVYEINDLLDILHNSVDNESIGHYKKVLKKDLYTYYITPIFESHRTHVVSMQWFPMNFSFTKYNLSQNTSNETTILATLGDDGYILIWDIKNMDRTIKNDTSNYIKPLLRVEVNKMDTLSKVSGTALQIRISMQDPLLFAATDEGQVYCVDWTIKNTQDNLTANIRKIYNTRLFRPVIAFEYSPFFPDVFLTLHDFYFCLWVENRTKPVFISPNLKSSCYTCAKFSTTRPSVIYISRNNGNIDIWDFLDESHKPSIKETFVKENISFMELFKYNPLIEDSNGNLTKMVYTEFLAVGDYSGQLTLLEVPKLFSQKVNNENEMMYNFIINERSRQEYMDHRYKFLEDVASKQTDDIKDLIEGRVTEKQDKDVSEHTEMTYIEEAFNLDKQQILSIFDLESSYSSI